MILIIFALDKIYEFCKNSTCMHARSDKYTSVMEEYRDN